MIVEEYLVDCNGEKHRIHLHSSMALSFPDHEGVVEELETLLTLRALGTGSWLPEEGCVAFLHFWRERQPESLRRLTKNVMVLPFSRKDHTLREHDVIRGEFGRHIWDHNYPFEREMFIRSLLFAQYEGIQSIEVAGWFRWYRIPYNGVGARFVTTGIDPLMFGRLIVRGLNVCEYHGEVYAGIRLMRNGFLELIRGPLFMAEFVLPEEVKPLGRELGRLSWIEC